jgi:hypothetical protein
MYGIRMHNTNLKLLRYEEYTINGKNKTFAIIILSGLSEYRGQRYVKWQVIPYKEEFYLFRNNTEYSVKG